MGGGGGGQSGVHGGGQLGRAGVGTGLTQGVMAQCLQNMLIGCGGQLDSGQLCGFAPECASGEPSVAFGAGGGEDRQRVARSGVCVGPLVPGVVVVCDPFAARRLRRVRWSVSLGFLTVWGVWWISPVWCRPGDFD